VSDQITFDRKDIAELHKWLGDILKESILTSTGYILTDNVMEGREIYQRMLNDKLSGRT
jgi:hypothetical protein